MATAMHVCGVKTPHSAFSRRLHCELIPSQKRLHFALSVASISGLCPRILENSCRGSVLRVNCEGRSVDVVEKNKTEFQNCDGLSNELTCVMKFGGSSVASADRMREVADLILRLEKRPVSCGISNVSDIDELSFVKELHLRTVDELGVDRSTVSRHLEELEQLLKGIAQVKELTLRTKDYLVSFGECLSTRIFAAYLNKTGVKARQYDAFEIGFITTDDFTNADILEATYPAVAKKLQGDWTCDPAIPIVTGFLGKGWRSCAVTTLGRGGSDLTATTIDAEPVPYLTFDEAAELAYFGAQVLHPQSMRPAREGDIPVRVKNSYNPTAPGTLITRTRDMSEAVLTSIILKRNVTMLDIVSTRMLGQFGFLAKVFSIFEDLGISVDVVATSEVSISLTLDPSKLWSRELIQQASELDHVVEELEKIAVVNLLQNRSIISLIGNVQRSSLILEKAFCVLRTSGVNVQMISQGASKTKDSAARPTRGRDPSKPKHSIDPSNHKSTTTMGAPPPWTDVDNNPPPSKRQAVPCSDNPDKPLFGKPTYDGVIAGKVSGRKWKEPRTHRASAINVSRKATTFEQRTKQKEIKRAYMERMTELKEEIRQNKVEKRKKREEREKKKQENILRSGTKLQKITNPKTLKKIAKSKQRKLLKVVPDDLVNNKKTTTKKN
ncbi:aspartate kinase 1 [Actinidia rufa]|uniref:Aspartate kinase 1 n=1 Tax=Actinidia rufa TaxID=165716 RepID=A0A7J0EF83_9ERIC|nr:aspartate kinase 1 [Actinidia rufa]